MAKSHYALPIVEVPEEIVDFLRQQVLAQVEANRLKEQELTVELAKVEARQRELDIVQRDRELRRQSENRRDGRSAEILERYAHLAEQVGGFIESGSIADSIMREGFEAFSGEIKVIKRGLYALLSRDGGEISKVKAQFQTEFDQEETQELLIKQQRNLFKLKARQAKFGMNAPLELLNEIEATEAEIERLSGQISP